MSSGDYRVAEATGQIAGFAQFDAVGGEIKMVYVHPRWSGKGIGHLLVSEIEKAAHERGLRRLRLRASLNAVAFYTRCGWREVGRTTHTLRTGREVPCIEMEKELSGFHGRLDLSLDLDISRERRPRH